MCGAITSEGWKLESLNWPSVNFQRPKQMILQWRVKSPLNLKVRFQIEGNYFHTDIISRRHAKLLGLVTSVNLVNLMELCKLVEYSELCVDTVEYYCSSDTKIWDLLSLLLGHFLSSYDRAQQGECHLNANQGLTLSSQQREERDNNEILWNVSSLRRSWGERNISRMTPENFKVIFQWNKNSVTLPTTICYNVGYTQISPRKISVLSYHQSEICF